MRRIAVALVGVVLLLVGTAWFVTRVAAPTPEEQAADRAEQARRQVEALEQLGYLGASSTKEPPRPSVPER